MTPVLNPMQNVFVHKNLRIVDGSISSAITFLLLKLHVATVQLSDLFNSQISQYTVITIMIKINIS